MNGEDHLRKLGALESSKTVVMVCDLQEKFEANVHFKVIVENTDKIVKCAQFLEMPVLATEQYPKGLGPTMEPLATTLKSISCMPVAKTKFSMMVPDIEQQLEALRIEKHIDTVILCGVETHVCILATCIDLIHRGFNVHVVGDATSSRTMMDRKMAYHRMRNIGAHITTTESCILALVGDAKHPQFKPIQALIKDISNASDDLF